MSEKPNILLVITHDTGRHLSCYGQRVSTPNMERLAREGVIFRQAYCTAPQCSPSRASLLTGMLPRENGMIGLAHRGFCLKPDVPRLPVLLGQAGYSTRLFGHQHEATGPAALGYEHFTPPEIGCDCRKIAPLVVEFLEHSPPQPFYAVAGFTQTHRPYPETSGPLDSVHVPPYLPDVPEVRRDVANLNRSVEMVDEAVGMILDALDRSGLAPSTLLIYTTDHGIAFPGAKATLFDPGIGIALLMRGPGGISGGREVGSLVSNMDVLPTLLEICGQPVPPCVEGKSLLPLIRGEAVRLREELFVELTYHAGYDPMRGIRTEQYKYIRSFEWRPWWYPPNVDGGQHMPSPSKQWFARHRPEVFREPRPEELLYDLTADPLERDNLADSPAYAGVLAELRERVEGKMRRTNDPLLSGPVPLPPGGRVTSPHSFEP